MYEVILPGIVQGIGRVMPAGMGEPNRGNYYSTVFPFDIHHHDAYEWMWQLENPSHIDLNGSVYELQPGDFCFIPPGTDHAELYTSQTKPYRSLWCSYKEESLLCTLSAYSPVGHVRPGPSRAVPATPLVAMLLPLLEYETKSNLGYTEAVRRSLVTSLAHIMTRTLESPEAVEQDLPGLPGYIERRVMTYLRLNYAHNVSLAQIARAMNLSRNYMCSTFKREAGRTIGEALTDIRLQRAKLLLLEGRLSVKEVARAVGYNSPEHFARVFHQHENISPGRYGR